jgi:hypothetical protein|tara:strand:+ start:2372 stop:2590 length:219 start_codon:yes stop_codon:yes gene_type:complete
MKLSNQAMGAIMMALQKSLMEQSDIVPVLQGFDFVSTSDGLTVQNPPTVQLKNTDFNQQKEKGEITPDVEVV